MRRVREEFDMRGRWDDESQLRASSAVKLLTSDHVHHGWERKHLMLDIQGSNNNIYIIYLEKQCRDGMASQVHATMSKIHLEVVKDPLPPCARALRSLSRVESFFFLVDLPLARDQIHLF